LLLYSGAYIVLGKKCFLTTYVLLLVTLFFHTLLFI